MQKEVILIMYYDLRDFICDFFKIAIALALIIILGGCTAIFVALFYTEAIIEIELLFALIKIAP